MTELAQPRADLSVVMSISDSEFRLFQRFMFETAGVGLAPSKRALVAGRLSKRARQLGYRSFRDYYQQIKEDKEERQRVVDALTTNETYFFREPAHFDFLRQRAVGGVRGSRAFRAWSAASSSGEEVYSIAMTLADTLGDRAWEVLGTDINSEVLRKARIGHYPMNRIDGVPAEYLRRFCLKGKGRQQGTFLVKRELRERVTFRQLNLNQALPRLGRFDVIFLRNVMIYFPQEIKCAVMARVRSLLAPGGTCSSVTRRA
ncbi:protein-glutamate O-methyltransferase CheR [Alkalilimnicola ehrlichii]|uniref:CheR family methyltransferase n=1 Tax=Alkalilimnicola ehrlichii TaxID=351052 RepID=UPI002161AA47|nr:protein-glutamate O-methyltransferase CheR [Alkalilimnicola ehrlichii]